MARQLALAAWLRYAVYVAQSVEGSNKQLLLWNQSGYDSAPGAFYINLGEVPYGVNSFEVQPGTLRSSFSHFVVFSRSAPLPELDMRAWSPVVQKHLFLIYLLYFYMNMM